VLTLRSLLSEPPQGVANVASVAFSLIGCAADLYTGTAYSPLSFYFPAAVYAAWFSNTGIGRFCIAMIAMSVLIVNSTDVTNADALYIALFNAVTRIATLIFVYWIVRRVHYQMQTLRRLNEQLQELDRQKDKLFGIISHDLRTPFNAVLGYSDLLEHNLSEASDQTRQYARNCHNAARSAYDLLENLLRWAQIQMKRIDPMPVSFEASSLVERCIETHRPAADLKKIKLEKDIADPALTCFADFSAAETVLRNLTNNAIKFTPPGGSISVGFQSKGEIVEFFVRDSGVGVSPERLGQLFTLTTSKTSSGTQGERGIGLGLVVCKDLAAQCGGTVTAESTLGEGSRFSFTLPAGRKAEGNVQPARA
jgi:signal transduction histidine kinase